MTEINSKEDWINEYGEIRKQLFAVKIDIPQILKLNRTTVKLKHEIIQMQSHQEKIQFDREIERNDLFIQIRKLRNDITNVKHKINQGDIEKATILSQDLEKNIEKFKETQIIVFEDMQQDEDRISQELDLVKAKIQHYDNINKNLQASGIQQVQILCILSYQKGNQINGTLQKLNQVVEQPELEEDEEQQTEQDYPNHPEDQEDEEQDINDEMNDSIDKILNNQARTTKNMSQQSEDICNKEIDALQQQINDIESMMNQNKQKVVDIDQKIKIQGGITCGWKKIDHDDFIKLKNKYKGQFTKPAFQKEYQATMAYLEPDDLQNHIQKYLNYCEYEEDKKLLLQSYKDLKENQQLKYKQIIDIKSQITQEKKKIREKTVLEDERQRKKLQLQQWKNNRLDMKDIEENKELLDMVQKKRDKDKTLKQRREAQKKLVQEYREAKIQEIEAKQTQVPEPEPKKRQFSLEAKQRILNKEEMLVKKKQQLILQQKLKKEEENIKKLKMLEGKSTKYANVESKLNEKTVASEQQQREKYSQQIDRFNDKSLNLAGGVKFYGKAIPSWRQSN